MIKIVKAIPDQYQKLSQLAQQSKAYWGYSAALLHAMIDELTYTKEQLINQPTFVATHDGNILGFYQLSEVNPSQVELDALFVNPDCIGKGIGKALFLHAVDEAKRLDYQTMKIQSDPNAAGFYAHMGGVQIGQLESLSVPGRQLPLFIITF